MSKTIRIILLSLIVSILSSGLTAHTMLTRQNQNSSNELIKSFYDTEIAVHVSPHGLRKKMTAGDKNFILVDLRSQEEYEREHIAGAINIPAYKDPDTSAYGDVDRIVGEFAKLNPSKDVIVYCYSTPCMTGRKVGKILAEHDIYVQHLAIGWNEWRYFWTLWNHEHEWEVVNVNDYVVTGSEPGAVEIKKESNDSNVCPIEGELGC